MKRVLGLLLIGAMAATAETAPSEMGPAAAAGEATVAPREANEAAAAVTPGETGAAVAGLAPAETIDLLDAITAALLHHPSLGISEEAIRKASGRRREANGALLPPLTFGYTEIWQQMKKSSLGGGAAMVTAPGESHQFSLGTQWVVFAGGALRANQAIARIAEVAAGHQYRATVNQLLGTTIRSYLQLLRAQEMQDVADRTVALAEEQVRVATDSYQADAVPRVNVLRSEAALQGARQGQLQAQNGIELAAAALNQVMGRSQLQPVRAAPVPRQLAEAPDLLQSLQLAVTQRAELRAAQKAIDINREAVRIAESGYWPTFVINGELSHSSNSGAFGTKDNFQVIGALKLNLWDWYQTSGKVRQAKADVATQRLELEQAMQGIELQVRSSVIQIANARERVTTAEAEVKAASEALNIEEIRYTSGEGIYLELLDARRALSEAEANLVTSYWDNATAESDWLTATGGYVGSDGQVSLPGGQTVASPDRSGSPGKTYDDLLADYGVTLPAAGPTVEASDE